LEQDKLELIKRLLIERQGKSAVAVSKEDLPVIREAMKDHGSVREINEYGFRNSITTVVELVKEA